MSLTVSHVLSATTPDDPLYEIQVKHWNSVHAVTMNVVATEISALFSNKNGVSFGLDGTNITGSVGAGVPSPVNFSAGTTSNDLGSVVFSNLNGLAFGLNGSTITGSYTVPTTTQFLTTAMASNRGSDFVQATAAFAGTNASGTINSTGISVSVGNYITTAMASNRASDFVQATAAFAGTSASGTINSTGISVSIGPYITTADLSANSSKYVQNWKLTGNTSGTTSSAQGTDLWFQGGNSLTVSGSSNSIVFSVGNYLTTAMASNRGTDFVQATAAFAGTNASGTINSTGISVSVGAAGGGATVSYWRNAAAELLAQTQSTQALTLSGSTSYIQPFVLDCNVSASYIRLLQSMGVSNTTSIATSANATGSASIFSTIWLMIYAQNTGASSLSLKSVASASAGMTQFWSLSANSTGSQWTLSQSITHPITGGTSQFTTGVTTSLSNYSLGSLSLTRFTGLQHFDVPFASSLGIGNYWILYGGSSATSTGGSGANFTQLRISNTFPMVSQINGPIPLMGQTTHASVQLQPGIGSFTTNAFGTTASFGLSNISSFGSYLMFPFQLIRST